jgi:hypothetical protein
MSSYDLSPEPIIKKPIGRPRKYPIDPNTGKTNYKLHVDDKRVHNKIQCPICHCFYMECNASHHKKTAKCKQIGELLKSQNKNTIL